MLCELVGRVIDDRYRITELLGTGGMGAVYEAEHLGLARKVAIKFIDREYAQVGSVASRFTRGARAASSIESEHIVAVYDAGASEGRPYLVMELLRGEDLGRRLRTRSKLPVAETLHIAAQTLRGLADAHEARIVHRDLKPDNIFLVSRKTDRSFVKIVDFGVSKVERGQHGTTQPFITRAGTVIGTPLYMSPEQAQAAPDLDARADLYSVGAIMFECITGRPPHVGESYEQIILSICMNDAPDLRTLDPGVSPELARVVERALRRDRARRFASARQMLVAVTTLPSYAHGSAPHAAERAPEISRAVAPEVKAGGAPPLGPRLGPGPVEPIAGKTLLAGGAADPLRLPSEDAANPALPVRTVLLGSAPVALAQPAAAAVEPAGASSEPRVLTRTQAEWSSGPPSAPAQSGRKRPVRVAAIIATGALATVTGAAITMWALPRFVASDPPSRPAHSAAARARPSSAIRPAPASASETEHAQDEDAAAPRPNASIKAPAP